MARVCDSCWEPGNVLEVTITSEGEAAPALVELCETDRDALLALDWSTLAQRKPAPTVARKVGGAVKKARKPRTPKPVVVAQAGQMAGGEQTISTEEAWEMATNGSDDD